MIIPINNSILYAEAIYLKADNENSMPEVKRVIVAYKDQIVMENSIDACLAKIFGIEKDRADAAAAVEAAKSGTPVVKTETGAVITLEEAKALYQELQNAMDKVNQLIQKIEKGTK